MSCVFFTTNNCVLLFYVFNKSIENRYSPANSAGNKRDPIINLIGF